ncbi:arylsulfatase [Stenotrophomonas panacihumi]|uniref:Arylsulfatase n=1 Tax=Stenotrophomonas panacihumi TaxID=676599 RepID=A0A0R0AQ96_9GAMM|nr:arylsulfatase [Stenotrophomonas panacihumi]KRG43271.1 arylsulfatase [Stenotrophomonas panacihumi]PTN55673.1 arylsulfatase [Stenotrophomonas panacihumi]
MPLTEYRPGSPFPGIIGRTPDVSAPAWPQMARPREGAPNVLFIVLDDTGYGHLGCYGSPIRTPNIDALAADGLLYNNMHTTALCSPSRSSMLTGRNHHSNHMGCLSNGSTGFPGTDGYMPFENGMLSEILKQAGYNTYCVGKWHLSPEETNTAAGPYDRWPLGRGFERFYGFLGGDTHQYYPELVHDNHQVEAPATPEQGYHLTPDLVEKAKAFIADAKQIAPQKPFFCYFALGAMHSPHHVPKEWADRYRGAFDQGWQAYREQVFARQKTLGIVPPDTQLPADDPDVQQWSALSADERRLYARMMEVFAGFLEHTDHYIGELIAFLKKIGEYDNTLIMLVSDNGSSAEGGPTGSVNECRFFNNVADTVEDGLKHIEEIGGPTTFNHFPWGWTHAGNTPFRRWKRETYRGGSSDPFIVTWPKRIEAKGEIRKHYCHLIDMVPTALDALGIEAPASLRGVTQSQIDGVSLLSTFTDAAAPQVHLTQYFEMMGHRSIYHDGWRAVCPWPGTSFTESGRSFGVEITHDMLDELDAHGWELYHLDEDFAEARNVAKDNPARVVSMIATWYVEAGKYHVLPIDSRGTQRIALERPRVAENLNRYTLYPNTQGIVAAAAPKTLNRPHSFVAEVDIPDGGGDGVLLSFGGNDGGFTFYVQDNRLCYLHNYLALDYFYVKANDTLPSGRHLLGMQFEPTGKPDIKHGKGVPGRVTLLLDGEPIAKGELPYTVPIRLGQGGAMLVGQDSGAPVNPEYEPPFRYAGQLERVIVDVSGEATVDQQAEMKAYLRKQ